MSKIATLKERAAHPAIQLVLCGFSILFWELLLIRWLGCSIRIVAYYTNFVLIAAFFGLGLGALLSRFLNRPSRLLFPALTASVLSGCFLGRFLHLNPASATEYIWFGRPTGFISGQYSPGGTDLPLAVILPVVYVLTAAVFTIFGQWLGLLFKTTGSLKAYTLEVSGSILGILAFALLSSLGLPPVCWIGAGTLGLLLMVERKRGAYALAIACSAVMMIAVAATDRNTIWSPYYKISFRPMLHIEDFLTGLPVTYPRPIGYALTVNNDYHQMMLDLRPQEPEHPFFTSWRRFYEAPYLLDQRIPPGPVLVVGAGTGNDVMAALRKTKRDVVAVEIDPTIAALGKAYHFEKPYDSSRVRLVIDDARSFFHKTRVKYAMVVFGFLDSHTLTSSYSSLRLDNFVYTLDSFRQVKRILLPGGQVTVTFATDREWIHERLLTMLSAVFGPDTDFMMPARDSYPNGIIYRNFNRGRGETAVSAAADVPTDDWPFLYLAGRGIPRHYWVFLCFVVGLGFLPLWTLPRGQRVIRLPYFFMGAAFFLLETSNVVSLSLLFGSTWAVNVLVFVGILALVQLGNLTAARLGGNAAATRLAFFGLAVSVAVSFATGRTALLAVDPPLIRAILAVFAYLGPVYFAALIFAILICGEKNLYQAYGSNILGAVVGGACEYASMLLGFQFLLLITAVFYLLAFLFLRGWRAVSPAESG